MLLKKETKINLSTLTFMFVLGILLVFLGGKAEALSTILVGVIQLFFLIYLVSSLRPKAIGKNNERKKKEIEKEYKQEIDVIKRNTQTKLEKEFGRIPNEIIYDANADTNMLLHGKFGITVEDKNYIVKIEGTDVKSIIKNHKDMNSANVKEKDIVVSTVSSKDEGVIYKDGNLIVEEDPKLIFTKYIASKDKKAKLIDILTNAYNEELVETILPESILPETPGAWAMVGEHLKSIGDIEDYAVVEEGVRVKI